MHKKVKLILEYDVGEVNEEEETSRNPKDWEEYFQQSDICVCDLEIVGVKVDNIGKSKTNLEDLIQLGLTDPIVYHCLCHYNSGRITWEDMLVQCIKLLSETKLATQNALIKSMENNHNPTYLDVKALK